MQIRDIIRRFSIMQLLRLSVLLFQNPLFIIPTLRATRKTMLICNELYGNHHHNNGRENAFRHALWNVLICQKTFVISKSEQKAVVWSKKVTDLHEKLAPNKPLEQTMDLHNNETGRLFFRDLKNASQEEVVHFLTQKTAQAKVLEKIEDTDIYTNDLVYLEKE